MCILRTRHARSPQRVARAPDKSHSRLHFAQSTRVNSAEGCARAKQIALSPAIRALDTHDLRRGLHFWLKLFVPPSAFKREFIKWGNVFHWDISRESFLYSRLHASTGILTLALLLHLDTYTCILALGCFHSYTHTGTRIEVYVFKCKCGTVSVQV